MNILKRIFWYVLVNMVVIATISIILHVLGLDMRLNAYGYDYQSLLIFCAIWGFAGSFISLLLSKVTVKYAMGVKIIPENTTNPTSMWLVQTVYSLAKSAGISKMPEVGIYESREVNAFATGPSKNSALVAVSSALLSRLNKDQIKGVLGHEIAHVTNGDMVTMTLLQGVINTFVMFFARIFASVISAAGSRDGDRRNPALYFALVMVFQIVLGLLGMILTSYFSRIREFRADKGGAKYAGTANMISALEALKPTVDYVDDSHQTVAAFKISGKRSKFSSLFATHPDLDTRIERLRKYI